VAIIKRNLAKPAFQDERRRECPDLICELSDEDPGVRRWAARDLVACPDSSLTLVERLKIEHVLSVREVILTTLIRLGDPAAVAGLVDCLRSDDVALRNEAIDAMKQLPDEVAPMMQGLITDPDPDVRIFAVNVLESMRHPEVEVWLVNVIQRDMHVNVCAAALDLLSEVGTAEIRGPLEMVKARFADEPYIQFAADLALCRIRGD
jgi:HEAT repeat protein